MADGVYDFIVVGAGPSGCVVAGRLSAHSPARVLVLEAGGTGSGPLYRVPAAAALSMSRPASNWNYRTEPVPGLGGRRLPWLAGRVLGGGGSINGLMFLRGGRHDFDRWRDEAGCPGWGFDDVLPYFRRFEGSVRKGDPWHGTEGPIATSPALPLLPISDLFLEAAQEAGLPLVDDLNAGMAEGAGLFDIMAAAGQRSRPDRAYLSTRLQGRERAGSLEVRTRTRVLRVDVAGGRACGVTYLHRGRVVRARAETEVILAAGAINTPQLLMLSGIGPAGELRACSIAPVLDLPEVGRNLQNHTACFLDYACSPDVTARRFMHPARATGAGLAYMMRRDGILAQAPCQAGAILRADPLEPGADTQIILGPGIPRGGSGAFAALPGQGGFRLMVNHGRPASRGRMRLRSSSPLDPPLIEPGYFSEASDISALRAGMIRAREIAGAGPLARVIDRPLSEAAGISASSDPEALIRRTAVNHFHPVGTCRMGMDEGAVVDTSLRLRGLEGLRIADTSAAPLLVNGNTCATALMLGERAAALILGEEKEGRF